MSKVLNNFIWTCKTLSVDYYWSPEAVKQKLD